MNAIAGPIRQFRAAAVPGRLKQWILIASLVAGALALLLAPFPTIAQQVSVLISNAHDGRWSVTLACPDIKDQTGLVSGYQYAFEGTVKDGRLEAQYGDAGSPNSLRFSGTVRADGELSISAKGNVGRSSDAAGKPRRGTPYEYTMTGSLGVTSGQAVRRETRACTATFLRQ